MNPRRIVGLAIFPAVGFVVALTGFLLLGKGCLEKTTEHDFPAEIPQRAVLSDWNTYHGDPSLTGWSPTPLSEVLTPAWSVVTGEAILHPPVVSNNHIYVATGKGRLFALDAAGEQAWTASIETGKKADGSPRRATFDAPLLVYWDTVYACDADGAVLAFDALTGSELWRQSLEVSLLGSPNVGVIPSELDESPTPVLYLIGQDEGTLFCLHAKTGAIIWQTEGRSRCDGSPGVGNGKVIFGSCDSALHVFSAHTGIHERDISIEGDSQVASGIAVTGVEAYTGCRSGKVLRINLDTGVLDWTAEVTEAEIFTTPSVAPEWVVVGDEEGYVYGINRDTGALEWKTAVDGTPLSPVIAGDKVLVSSDGTLHVLRLRDGELLISKRVSDEITGPTLAGDLVMVGSDEGIVTAFFGNVLP